ncbi:methyltransferase [Liquorilactobacillus aquaticus DSM 21051]|uniref:Methyltransferase n=1 Tax=Liquorilactobacillus aquaticus DSM 21051 TaxID=1423725 RepID=A0A0R2CXE1_9LACO|nr:16S rRNA (guanine(966)-N(2))-methyltransferase RsmD [Liquorilactobacillus aquaticus]KRM96504.1 methyltransferase [Liquorilactobacillus aquaticus DSM 21051]
MRVIAGEYGGRRLKAVPGMKTRPTTDKVKESIFNMIGPFFAGGRSLDLFAGSGGLSIEAVSRGVANATLVDRQYLAIKTIKENISVTKEPQKFDVFKADAVHILTKLVQKKQKFNYVFLDPPYKKQQILEFIQRLEELGLLEKGALLICETNQDAKLPADVEGFELYKRADYGITEITIYQYRGE